MPRLRSNSPLTIALAYASVAGMWIVASDSLFAFSFAAAERQWLVNIVKGLGFVAVTSFLLYHLCRKLVGQHEASLQQLRESELQLKLALDASGDGFWDWNLATGHVEFSNRALAIFGYEPGMIAPEISEWQRRIHPDDRDFVMAALQRQLDGRSDTEFVEHRILSRDGTYRWAQSRGRVTQRAPDGRPLRMIGLVSDISDRKAAAIRIEEELSFNKALLQASPIGITSYMADGRAISANEAAARIVGGSVQDLLSQNFREIESWRSNGLTKRAEKALREDQAIPFSTDIASSFGRSFWIEGTMVPFRYHEEQRLLCIFQDLTEVRQTSRDLHLLESAIEAAESGWMTTDATGVITAVNPGFCRLTGYSRDDLIGQTPRILRSGQVEDEAYEDLWQTILRGEVWTGDLVNRRKDGTLYTQRTTIVPIKGAEDSLTNFVAITHDISDQKALEEQVHRAQRLESIGMLASGVAHDLNNILAPILMSIELLKRAHPDPASLERLNVIESTALRGAGIVRQVLTFSRGMEGERVKVQPRHLLRDIQTLIRETFPREIEIHLRIAPSLPAIVGDPTQLHQVMLNLAINARDAMPKGGLLELGASGVEIQESRQTDQLGIGPGDYVALTIRDTGVGMSPEVREHVFEPFFTTKVRGKGTGLGLSTVYGIVRSHSGAIAVDSTLGSGTTFTVYLPTAASPSTTAPPLPQKEGELKGKGRRILIVDDEEPIREITSSILESMGFEVETAPDGVAGLEKFAAAPVAVIILDMMMPRMNGANFARAIRTTHPHQKIIGSSGLLSETGSRSGFEPELDEQLIDVLLRKPFTEQELVAALTRALGE